jgi:hypothetical protein
MSNEPKYEISKGEIYSGTYSELLRYFREVLKVRPSYKKDEIEKADEGNFELSKDLTLEVQLDRIKGLERPIGRLVYLKCEFDKTEDPPNVVLKIDGPFVHIRSEELVKAVQEMFDSKGIPDETA